MVEVAKRRCGDGGCSKRSSYGVVGSKKAEFCSKHARAGMVTVVHKTCGYEGCFTRPSYGMTGSKKAEFCSKHARTGMVDVVNKTCGYEGCSTHPSYGMVGSKKAEFCLKHAKAGMVDVVSRTCCHEGCSTPPSYGMAGSKKAEFCSKHARAGMVNVVSRRCSYEGCSTHPSYGMTGSKKAEFCLKHARLGMVNVKNKTCSYEGCSTHPSYGMAGSRKAEFCSKHARAGMMNVKKTCREKGCSKSSLDKGNFEGEALCRQRARAHNTDRGTPGRSAAEGDGGSISNVQGVKRKRAALSGFGANDGVGIRRGSCTGSRQGKITPMLFGHFSLLSRHPPLGTDDEVCLRAGAGMKVELAVPSPAQGGDGMRKGREQTAPSSGLSSKRFIRGIISSDGGGIGRPCDSLVLLPGCLGTFHDVALKEVEMASNVKLELGV